MLEAAAELLRGVKQQSRNTRKRRPCHRPRRHAGSWSSSSLGTLEKAGRATGPDAVLEAAAELLRGVKQQSRNTGKRRPCHRPTGHAGSCSGTRGGSSSSLGTLEKGPWHRRRRHAGSCSGTFEGGQEFRNNRKRRPCHRPRRHAGSCSAFFESVPQAQTPSWRWRQPAATPGEQLLQHRRVEAAAKVLRGR